MNSTRNLNITDHTMADFVGTNDTDQIVRQRRQTQNFSCDVNMLQAGAFQSKSRYRNGRRERKRRRSTGGLSLFIGLVVVIFGSVLSLVAISVTRYYSSSSSSTTRDEIRHIECTESHINGISGNIYTWCYKNKKDNHHHQSRKLSIHGKISESISKSPSWVERVMRDKSGKNTDGKPKRILAAIEAHEHLQLGDIVSEDQDDLCYADFSRLGTFNIHSFTTYYQPVIGPCHYDYRQVTRPTKGFEEEIDFFFFRDSDEAKFTDKIRCLNECVDRVLVGRDEVPSNDDKNLRERQKKENPIEKSMEELELNDKVAVDDYMLIEAVTAGMTFIVEKLIVKYSLDPFYRPVQNDPSSSTSRSLNAIQEAIRGGYAEIVAILTKGDNSVIIDDYGRSVEDYVKMNGSPILPRDAKNVLGIEVEEKDGHQRRKHKENHGRNSGWNETSATPYNKDHCDFDVFDKDLPAEIFYRDYFITGRPLALRGVSNEMELDFFSKKRWKETEKFHPNKLFQVGPTAYPPLTDQDSCSLEMSIEGIEEGALCEEMPEKPMIHAFHPKGSDFEELFPGYDGDIFDSRGGFRTIQKWFPHVEEVHDAVWQVFFGGDGSGATYHWHEAAFNILYVGTKEWTIGPPLYRGTTGMSAQKVSEKLDNRITYTCVQQPGDLFYIPDFWGHSTLNHGFTIGAAAIVQDFYQSGGSTLRGETGDDDSLYDDAVQPHSDNSEEIIPFLFVHINKTGGTSLIRMFEERCEEEYYGGQWWDENDNFHRAFHATAHAYIEYYGSETWNDAYTFAVVRHPLARQVSNFFFLASNGCSKNADKCEERLIPKIDLSSMTDEEKMDVFHEWILNVYNTFPPGSTDHYRFGAAGHGNEVYDTFSSTQTSWLVDPDGTIVVKEIFHLETLSNDMSKLAENIPCLKNGPLEMDHSNKTPNYPDYMLFARNKKTRRIINEVFADDFKNFAYKPL